MIGLKDMLFPLCAAMCALAFLYKLYDLRYTRRDPALIALLVAFAGKGISFTLSTPVVSAAVDRVTGIPNLGALGIHLFGGVASSAAFLVALVYWVYPRPHAGGKALARVAVAVVFAMAMAALWLAASHSGGRSQHFLLNNAHRPVIAAYLLFYVTAFGTGMAEILRLCRRYGPGARRPWLRRGLGVTAVGAIACIVYCLNRASAVVAVQIGLNPLRWEVVTPVANTIGIFCIAAGFTMPSWGPRLTALRRWIHDYTTYRHLYPLWRDICRALPEIALSPPDSPLRDQMTFRDLGFRLYRRIIEINDGRLALRPYMGATTAAIATAARHAGLTGQQMSAAVEAERLRSALRARRDNEPVDGKVVGSEELTRDNDTYTDEIAWLTMVARAYACLPQPAPPPNVQEEKPNTTTRKERAR